MYPHSYQYLISRTQPHVDSTPYSDMNSIHPWFFLDGSPESKLGRAAKVSCTWACLCAWERFFFQQLMGIYSYVYVRNGRKGFFFFLFFSFFFYANWQFIGDQGYYKPGQDYQGLVSLLPPPVTAVPGSTPLSPYLIYCPRNSQYIISITLAIGNIKRI